MLDRIGPIGVARTDYAGTTTLGAIARDAGECIAFQTTGLNQRPIENTVKYQRDTTRFLRSVNPTRHSSETPDPQRF